ncbi:MAG: hypothetical protein ACN4GR_04385 [Arenicellales bacterium]
MSNNIPDLTKLELHGVAAALKERYSRDLDLLIADAEMQIDRGNDEYDETGDCVLTLLVERFDYEAQHAGSI